MADPFQTHYYTENGKRHVIKLRDVYSVAGTNVAQALGLTRAADNFESQPDDEGMTVNEGLITGKLARIRISYRTAAGKTKSTELICPMGMVKTAIPALLSKTFKNGNIVGAGIKRRRRLG